MGPQTKELGKMPEEFIGVEHGIACSDRIFSLPMRHYLSAEDQEQIAEFIGLGLGNTP
ncbi:MAG: hypothetical protein JRJ29_17460 [Deltaproteobacteria bacterium]|nr:hypothetical protein [Deltaproteobacteria bacterium]